MSGAGRPKAIWRSLSRLGRLCLWRRRPGCSRSVACSRPGWRRSRRWCTTRTTGSTICSTATTITSSKAGWRLRCGLCRGSPPVVYHNDHSRPENRDPHSGRGDRPRGPRSCGQSEVDRRSDAPRLQGRLRDGGDGGLPVRLRRHARCVADHHFDAVFEAYWRTITVRGFMAAANPAALREMAELREAVCRGACGGRAPMPPMSARRTGSEEADEHRRHDRRRDQARHAEKMAKQKAVRDRMMATKTREKGLLIVHTGKGKGKSTAAFGMVMRAIGHGLPAASSSSSRAVGHRRARRAGALPRSGDHQGHGRGLHLGDAGPRPRYRRRPCRLGPSVKAMMRDPAIAGAAGRDQHRAALRLPAGRRSGGGPAGRSRPDKHVIVTGRNAKEELIELADLVTEMTMVKHPFREGVKAQAGIEF